MDRLPYASGSVIPGIVADIFEQDNQQYAVLWASLLSCVAAVLGSIARDLVEYFLDWQRNFCIQLILGVATGRKRNMRLDPTRS